MQPRSGCHKCSVQEEIAEEDLAGRGLDVGPIHITLRYGIEGDDISAIEALLAPQSPIAATLGATSCFPPSATRDVAVLIATIVCPKLHALHQRLGEVVDFAERWNPILDVFDAEGVRFAHEVHPSEIAYDYWTADGRFCINPGVRPSLNEIRGQYKHRKYPENIID